jgi:hypothetical protein
LTFSVSDGLPVALMGRVLMGFGVSGTFVGVIYLVGRGYGEKFAFMSSLSLSLAYVSAATLAISSAFFPLLVDFRLSFQVLAALFVVGAVLVFALAGGRSVSGSGAAKPPLSEAFKATVSSGQFWAALVFYCGMFGTVDAFGDLWNIQFQMNFFGHTVQQSTVMNSMIPLGITFGGLVAGAWAVKSGFVLPARVFAGLTVVCFIVLVLVPLPTAAAAAVLFITGWGLSGAMLGLVALQRHLPPYAAPLATSLVATAANIFGGAVQPLIGYAVGVRPRGELLTIFQSSNPDFGTAQRGLILVLVSVLLALIASFCFRPAPSQAEPAG